jgi:uncharacterized protein YggE
MKSKLLIFGFLVVFLLASCNTATGETTPSTLSANGTGSASTEPDVVDIQLGVDTVDADIAVAVDQNTVKMNEIMAVFSDMGVDDKDIQTTNYNLWVEEVYDQNGQSTGEKRYHVSNTVSVRLRDLNKIGSLIEEATKSGATNVFGINFSVADITELEQAALENAIENAQGKAEWMASNIDSSLGPIVKVIEGGFISPVMPVAAEGIGGGAAEAVPISQGQFRITAQVQVIYEILP